MSNSDTVLIIVFVTDRILTTKEHLTYSLTYLPQFYNTKRKKVVQRIYFLVLLKMVPYTVLVRPRVIFVIDS